MVCLRDIWKNTLHKGDSGDDDDDDNIAWNTNCKCRMAATLYTLET
jgi:hypothetical protein